MHFKFTNSQVVNCFCDHAYDVQMVVGAGSGVTVDIGVKDTDTQSEHSIVQVCMAAQVHSYMLQIDLYTRFSLLSTSQLLQWFRVMPLVCPTINHEYSFHFLIAYLCLAQWGGTLATFLVIGNYGIWWYTICRDDPEKNGSHIKSAHMTRSKCLRWISQQPL